MLMHPISYAGGPFAEQYSTCGTVLPTQFSNINTCYGPLERVRWNVVVPPTTSPFQSAGAVSLVGGQVVIRGPLWTVAQQIESPKISKPQEGNTALPRLTQALLPNQLHLEKSLGYGAFGVVWLVVDPRTGHHVALKRIPNVFESVTAARRAYREIYLLSQLKHLNVVKLIDVVKVNSFADFNEVSLLCEFVDTDLHKIIVSPQYLSMDHIKLFVYQILRGLKYIHSAGIIHRDLKPGNLLVTANCLLKICDFGLARSSPMLESDEPSGALTMEVVTQFYRSPELLLGSCFYTTAIDQWSVGCILAELLTRRILFQSMNPFRQLEMIFDLLGSPTPLDLVDLVGCPSLSVEFLLSRPVRPPNHAALLSMLTPVNQQKPVQSNDPPDTDLLALLTGLLSFGPSKRLTAERALNSPFVAAGRARFHSCMCTCCPRARCVPVSNPCQPTSPLVPSWTDTSQSLVRHSATLNSASTLSSSPRTPPSPFVSPQFSTDVIMNLTALGLHPAFLPQLTVPPPMLIPPPQAALEPSFVDSSGSSYLNTEVRMTDLGESRRVLWDLIEDYFRHDLSRNRPVASNFSPSFGPFITSSVAYS
ncbi:unnamed protein product [Calicophoron daubneyi]|uniref:Mitogen-activated protein kinase n=1 Tax=Calicophoron daubneyi TaxID=300641 RepID=A0AAV2T1E0_CALDB